MGGLRAKLGLWHAALMALTLLGLSGLTYILLNGFLHSRADAALREYADTTARQIAASLYRVETENRDPAASRSLTFLSNDIRTWGRYIQVIYPNGTPREWSDGLNSHQLPVSAEVLKRGLAGESTLETVRGLGEHPVRVVTVPVRMGSRVPLLVQAGTSLEGVEAALQRAGWLLLIITPVVFLLALVGNGLVVDRALRRVDELTRTAIRIQESNHLEARVNTRTALGASDAGDEIGRLAQAFDQMIARLDRSFRQVKQFSADASHELKTPLTAIRGEAEVALMGDRSPEDYRESLGSILESAERMSSIVESLLLLARAEGGQSLIRQEPVELAEVVLEALDSLEGFSERNGVALLPDELEDVTVHGDRLWLCQIVTNLLTNGVKYTPSGGVVTLRLVRDGDRAVLTVTDTGIGIAPDHLPHIFDRFYRVDSGRARTAGGAGLGLSITRWAVDAHGGGIRVESDPGSGSTFTVSLPLDGADEGGPAEGGQPSR